ncbi:uncharacterized protein LOC129146391 isoform X2 [Talpa occidentalis]|uniref:uncharacterized protein LOC129146391 isoform X2 n=1 Tax=Talpa occidentalis TaxID=50954 RepID=UPI0023F916DF|nr:uncharacterized protein LOC129146391 isoform X2 [Talpa occidentalis]
MGDGRPQDVFPLAFSQLRRGKRELRLTRTASLCTHTPLYKLDLPSDFMPPTSPPGAVLLSRAWREGSWGEKLETSHPGHAPKCFTSFVTRLALHLLCSRDICAPGTSVLPKFLCCSPTRMHTAKFGRKHNCRGEHREAEMTESPCSKKKEEPSD